MAFHIVSSIFFFKQTRAEVCTKNRVRIVTGVEDSIAKRIAVLGIEKIGLERNTMKHYIFHNGFNFGSPSSMFNIQNAFSSRIK